MAAVLIIAGALLVSVAAGLAAGVAFEPLAGLAAGMAVAGLLALWFGVDATRDVLPEKEEATRPIHPRSAPAAFPEPGVSTMNLLESA